MNYLLILLVKLLFPKYWMLPASLVYAQAYHETGGFTSLIYRENNNLFGMKRSVVRTNHTGTSRGHATYRSRFKSIFDYFQRQKQFSINYNNQTQYIDDTVNSGYAEDKRYLPKWTEIYTRKKYLSIVSLISLPAIFGLIYFLMKK